MRLQVRHRTTYHYSEPVTLGHTEARLMPPDRGRQRRLSFDLQVFPTPKVCHSREDAFGNAVTRFSVETPHEELVVEAHSLMQIAPAEVELPLAGPLTVAEVQKAFRDPQTEAQRLHRLFCLPSAYVPQLPELRDYGLESFHPQRDVVAATKELMERIHDDFQYDPTATEVATPLREVFEGRAGGYARILPTAPSACSGPWACLRLIARAIWKQTLPPGVKSWWALMPPTPGSPYTCPSRGGLSLIRRTVNGRLNAMYFSGRAGTTVTRRHSAGSSRGRTSRGSCERRCARPAAGVTKGGGQP